MIGPWKLLIPGRLMGRSGPTAIARTGLWVNLQSGWKLAIALAHEPTHAAELDEPTQGMAPRERIALIESLTADIGARRAGQCPPVHRT